tara:strand:- start:858 stop:2042 length:1185 start_codon:yes stop_codon:yes gene_type:complete
MSEIKVNSIKGVGASNAAITINNTDGTCTANITNNLSNRNLIINGAFLVAQRSSDPVNDDSYRTVDRFQLLYGGTDNHPTQAQHALTSSDTGPYEKGFRFSYHITNGDQTSGAGSGDYMNIRHRLESRNIAQSGWNYTSSSSFVTLSFWVKSSVSQNFYGYLYAAQGTPQLYTFETGILTANTWTKVTKTISGNSNLVFDSSNGVGLDIVIAPFWGTDYTDSGVSLNSWGAYASGTRTPDYTNTWYTTNDATFEITGVQLEVGSVATDFEHRSYADTFLKCQRYYHVLLDSRIHESTYWHPGYYYIAGMIQVIGRFAPEMRATPSATITSGTDYYRFYRNGSYDGVDDFLLAHSSKNSYRLYNSTDASGTAGQSGAFYLHTSGVFKLIAFDAEL